MKIRPKTFECVRELIKQGYVLYINENAYKASSSCNKEILLGNGYTWRNGNNHIWQGRSDWYFKK